MSILEVKNLCVDFKTSQGTVRAIDRVSFSLETGELLGIVGESGSGKSVTSLAIMGLITNPGVVTADKLMLNGKDLLAMSARQRRGILGSEIAMIFQDPMTSLNPCFTVGYQITETLKIHNQGKSKKERYDRAIQLLEAVGIPDAPARLKAYPHQLSGGMSQRVMIAMAIACQPKLLIADEPTTALDVTIQAQILNVIRQLNEEKNMSVILITHDLAVVSEMADRIMVMYCGQAVETGATQKLLRSPQHPYTQALLNSIPDPDKQDKGERLPALPGVVPSLFDLPKGCRLEPRCGRATEQCKKPPELEGQEPSQVRCFHPLNQEQYK